MAAVKILYYILIIVITLFSIFSFISLFSIFTQYEYYDELQKKIVYETFSISFFCILIIHFIQLFISFLGVDLSYLISPATGDGILLGVEPIHIDSFFFDLLVFGIVYLIKRIKYQTLLTWH